MKRRAFLGSFAAVAVVPAASTATQTTARRSHVRICLIDSGTRDPVTGAWSDTFYPLATFHVGVATGGANPRDVGKVFVWRYEVLADGPSWRVIAGPFDSVESGSKWVGKYIADSNYATLSTPTFTEPPPRKMRRA